MSGGGHRKRGGTFHLEDLDNNEEDEHNVQFVTPFYDESAMPEPLDLSKLCLDDDLFEKDAEEGGQEEEQQTRGRSRSRSVHENDLAAPGYIPAPEVSGSSSSDGGSDSGQKGKKNGNSNAAPAASDDKNTRRGGPLQQREVQALKKVIVTPNMYHVQVTDEFCLCTCRGWKKQISRSTAIRTVRTKKSAWPPTRRSGSAYCYPTTASPVAMTQPQRDEPNCSCWGTAASARVV